MYYIPVRENIDSLCDRCLSGQSRLPFTKKNSFSAHNIHSTKSYTHCYENILTKISSASMPLSTSHMCVWWENLRSLSTNCEYRLKTSLGQRAEWMGVRGWCCKDKNVADLTRSAPETRTVHWKRALCRYNFLACYRFDCRGLACSEAFVHREISQPPPRSLQLQQTWISPIFIVFICQGICLKNIFKGCFRSFYTHQRLVWSVIILPEKKMVPIQGLWRVKLKFWIILEAGEARLTMTISTFLTSSLVAELC